MYIVYVCTHICRTKKHTHAYSYTHTHARIHLPINLLCEDNPEEYFLENESNVSDFVIHVRQVSMNL